MVQKFANTARERIRIDGGGYRREHLRALAQRVEVADKEVRILGSKGDLLRTLAAASGVTSATSDVCNSVLNWRRGRDSNPRYPRGVQRFSRPSRSTAPAPLRAPIARLRRLGGALYGERTVAGNRCHFRRLDPFSARRPGGMDFVPSQPRGGMILLFSTPHCLRRE